MDLYKLKELKVYSLVELRKIKKEDFIILYESFKSSRAFSRHSGFPRSTLENIYLNYMFKPETKTLICANLNCNKTFIHTPKSFRDSTKTCKECKKERMRQVCNTFIKGKPSHRRKTLNQNKSEIEIALQHTFFRIKEQVEQNEEKTLKLECICGKEVSLSVKDILRPEKSAKKSCGCKKSKLESEFCEFIEKTIYPKVGLRNKKYAFLNGLELDYYIPELNIAFEFNGLAHHSERPVFSERDPWWVKTHQKNKYTLCKNAGVKLVQIYEDEWLNKKSICESMLKARLGKITEKYYARDLNVMLLDTKQQIEFFNENHVAGYTVSKYSIGLTDYSGNIFCALSLRHYTKGSNTVEIARFASKINTICVGGFQKLISQSILWAKQERYVKLLTYADLRFGEGTVYITSGFTLKGITEPNYFYENGRVRSTRYGLKKKNDAESLLLGSTEITQNKSKGLYRIFDCGSNIYIREI